MVRFIKFVQYNLVDDLNAESAVSVYLTKCTIWSRQINSYLYDTFIIIHRTTSYRNKAMQLAVILTDLFFKVINHVFHAVYGDQFDLFKKTILCISKEESQNPLNSTTPATPHLHKRPFN